jgi:predicted nucleotidyltransferase
MNGGDTKEGGQEAKEPSCILRVVENTLQRQSSEKLGRFRVLQAMIAGSSAFNLALPSSDIDYFGVYASDIDVVLSMNPPVATVDSHDPDTALYEVKRYCELLLKGNPKVIEPLFTDHLCWQSEEWLTLKMQGKNFLTQVTCKQYVKFAQSQIFAPEPTAKQFYHAIRLLTEAERIVLGHEPQVWFADGTEEKEFLMSVRTGKVSVQEMKSKVETLMQKVKLLIPQNLPPTSDLALLSEWLVSLRRHEIGDKIRTGPDLTQDFEASEEALRLKQKAEELLQAFNVQGKIVCCVPSGSRRHGLAVEGSGEDYIAIFIASTDSVVSMSLPPKKIDAQGVDSKQKEGYAPGLQILEVGYACSLLSHGNNRLHEMLYFDSAQHNLPSFEVAVWLELKQLRNELITQATLNHYIGVAQGQLQARPLGPKNLYHAYRLLLEAEEMVTTRSLKTHFKPEEKAFLLRIREATPSSDEGEFSVAALATAAAAKVEALQARRDCLSKASPATWKALNSWLVRLRHSQWLKKEE